MEKKNRTDYKRQFNEDHYKRIGLYVKPDEYDRWKQTADASGQKMSEFIKGCVNDRIGE